MTTTKTPTDEPVNHTALRLARTPGDMAKAVLVLLVPVIIAVGVYVFFFGGSKPIAIDTTGTLATAKSSAHFTVLEPTDLASGWKPITAQYSPGSTSTLRVGYIAPSGDGVQLLESNKAPDALVRQELGAIADNVRTVDVGGLTWSAVNPANGTGRALINTSTGRTVIIKGGASEAEMEALAASLH